MTSHSPNPGSTTSAENFLAQIMRRDRAVLSKRADAEAAAKKEDMRANSRAAALQRAERERKSKSQPAVVPPTAQRRRQHA